MGVRWGAWTVPLLSGCLWDPSCLREYHLLPGYVQVSGEGLTSWAVY